MRVFVFAGAPMTTIRVKLRKATRRAAALTTASSGAYSAVKTYGVLLSWTRGHTLLSSPSHEKWVRRPVPGIPSSSIGAWSLRPAPRRAHSPQRPRQGVTPFVELAPRLCGRVPASARRRMRPSRMPSKTRLSSLRAAARRAILRSRRSARRRYAGRTLPRRGSGPRPRWSPGAPGRSPCGSSGPRLTWCRTQCAWGQNRPRAQLAGTGKPVHVADLGHEG